MFAPPLLTLFSLYSLPIRIVVRGINQLLKLVHQVAQPMAYLLRLWHWQKIKICPLRNSVITRKSTRPPLLPDEPSARLMGKIQCSFYKITSVWNHIILYFVGSC